MEELDEPFTLPKKFDPEEYFKNFFAVIVGNDQPTQDVLIRVVNDQTKYLDTLPLHSSQQKIEEKSDDTHTVYRYRLVPTFDFKQELLRLGPSVEVLEPEELRDEIVDDPAPIYQPIAQSILDNQGVGYPAADSDVRTALSTAISGAATFNDLKSKVDAFMNESAQIELPTDGKAYRIKAKYNTGDVRWLKFTENASATSW